MDDRAFLESVCRAARLCALDREVLRPRIEDDLLQRQIAQRVGMSRMQVSRRLVV